MGKIACRFALLFVTALPACSLAGAGAPSAEAGRQRALEYGMRALDSGDYEAAAERLAPVAAICPTDALGRRAMLLLAAAELDARNGAGRADVAAELAAFQIARAGDEWEGALATELYVIALDFGATPVPADSVPGADVIWTRYLGGDGAGAGGTPLGMDADGAPTQAALDAEADADDAARRVSADAEGGPRCDVRDPADDFVLPVLAGTPLAQRTAPATPQPAQPSAALSNDVRALQSEVERLRGELARKDQELDRIRRTLRP